MRSVGSGGRALLFIGLLALCAGLFSASTPPAEAQSPQDPSVVCPPPMPPFIQVPCFDLDDRDSTLPIDDDSRNKLSPGQPSGAQPGPAVPTPPVPTPAAPDNFAVNPGNGYLDLSWNAVAGATHYDIRAREAGVNDWRFVARKITGTSYRYTTSKTIDQVAVRARNADATGPWTELSRLPDDNWLTTVQSAGGAGASSSGGSIAAQLDAPTGLTVTRENSPRNEKLYVSWTAVTGATGYNLACAASPGGSVAFTAWKWWHCGSVTSGSTTTFTVDDDGRGGFTRDLIHTRSYAVAVRAVTANAADASPWTASDDAHPALMAVKPITVSRAAGSLTLSWTQPLLSTGYEIWCATIENGVLGADQLCADVETATPDGNRRVTATITSWTVGNTSYTVDDGKTYSLVVVTTNAWGESPGLVAPTIHPNPTLTASNVSDDSATLTIAHHTGAWYYRSTTAGQTTCTAVAANTSAVNLTGLTGGTAYTYSAYSDSTCSTLLVTATFTTFSAVSNLDETSDAIGIKINGSSFAATAFTTGDNSGGYMLRSVTAEILRLTSDAGDLTVAIHAVSGSQPADTATYTLSPSNPTGPGEHTFACSGACPLSRNTSYFLVLSGNAVRASNGYDWDTTVSLSQTNTPTTFGWSIADSSYWDDGRGWTEQTGAFHFVGKFSVAATLNPSLTSSSITATGATLTIGGHTGQWWYKATSGPHTTCQGPVAAGTSTKALTGLTAGTNYTYSAYGDSACTTGNLLATAAAFTTLATLTSSNVAATTATLTIAGHTGAWYYKHTNTGATCDGPVAANTASKDLTGLTAGTAYTYSAYSNSGCTTLLATASQFTTTASLTASSVTGTGATLTLAGHSGNWWYQANRAPDASCSTTAETGTTKTLSSLTAGTVYAYTAYSASGCASASRLATAVFGTPTSVSVSNISEADGPAAFNLSSDYAQKFTTGSAAGGYTLKSVTLDFTIITNASQIEASIRAVQSDDTPATTARATLTGTAAIGQVTFTCDATNTNNDCSLAANTSYFVYAGALSFTANQQTTTASDAETLQPSGNGWSIANAARYQANSWNEHPQSLAMKMTVSATGGAASASLAATSTALTISDYTGSWHYQANAAPYAACSSAVSTTSTTISGLTSGASYTFKAYADSTCAPDSLLATAAAFTATASSVSVSTLDGALFQSY